LKRLAIPLAFCVTLLSLAHFFALLEGATAAQPGQSQQPAVIMASGLLQKCLGITRGADKMMKGPGTQPYCKQLPGASIFDQAGDRFRAGDHAGAAQIVSKAAAAGNAVAQLRLALMYDQVERPP
jgi:hypothetical protein